MADRFRNRKMDSNQSRRLTLVLSIATVALVSAGCGTMSDVLDRRQTATNQQLSVADSTLSVYLDDIALLLGEDTVAANRAWAELSLDYERAATTTNSLRLALAMATPGHSRTDLARADAMLTGLLQQPELLLTDEQLLAKVHLGLLRSRITAEYSARQANDSANRNTARELDTAQAQLQLLQTDNQRLRESLAATEQKLRAIMLIERSIREREDDAGNNQQDRGSTLE